MDADRSDTAGDEAASARLMLLEAALLRGTFTLRSGRTSDRYFDKFRVTCTPRLLAIAAEQLEELRHRTAPDVRRIVAPALGAVPLATALSLASGVPLVIVRDSDKQYGTRSRLEGGFEAGDRAVLVEDVVTSGGAALDALDEAHTAGIDVVAALCLLDRDGGGREALAARGVPLTALLGSADLDAAFEAGLGSTTPSHAS